MRHVSVRRLARALAAGFLVAAAAFAWIAGRSAPTVSGAGPEGASGGLVFDAHCALCHQVDDLLVPLRAADDVPAALRNLEVFLATHGDTSADDDRLIRVYLESRLKAGNGQ